MRSTENDSVSEIFQKAAERDLQRLGSDDSLPPDFEDLVSYRKGELAPEKTERIRVQLVADPQLARRYLELDEVVEDIEHLPSAESFDPEKAWVRFEANRESGALKRSMMESSNLRQGSAESADSRFALATHHLGWAAALILIVGNLLWLSFGTRQLISTENVVFEHLQPAEDVRRSDAVKRIEVSAGDISLLLPLETPSVIELGFDLPSPATYIIQVDGRATLRGYADLQDEGLYLMSFPIAKAEGGVCQIQLFDPTTDLEIGTYRFEVHRAASP